MSLREISVVQSPFDDSHLPEANGASGMPVNIEGRVRRGRRTVELVLARMDVEGVGRHKNDAVRFESVVQGANAGSVRLGRIP